MSKTRTVPPEWCEKPLEQAITGADEAVEIESDKRLIYDGNQIAQARSMSRPRNKWSLQPRLPI